MHFYSLDLQLSSWVEKSTYENENFDSMDPINPEFR